MFPFKMCNSFSSTKERKKRTVLSAWAKPVQDIAGVMETRKLPERGTKGQNKETKASTRQSIPSLFGLSHFL